MTLQVTVLFDAYLEIDGVTVSDHANKVEVPVTVEAEETTAFGDKWKTRVGGLKDAQLTATFYNDFQDGNLDETMWANLGEVVTFEVRPTSDAVSATNPSYTGSILINGWKPLSSDVGKTTMVDIAYPTSGEVLRSTT